MLLFRVFSVVSFSTVLALEWSARRKCYERFIHLPYFEVAPLVVLHVAPRSESLAAADGTIERSLVTVDPQMHPEVLLLAEGFETALDGALERLSPVVEVQMRPKPCLAAELFRTVREWAHEKLLLARKSAEQLVREVLPQPLPVSFAGRVCGGSDPALIDYGVVINSVVLHSPDIQC